MRFLSSELPDTPPEQAGFHIIPAPLEKTVSYGKGTRRGPSEIIKASDQLEELNRFGDPAAKGIYTKRPLSNRQSSSRFLRKLQESVTETLESGALPVTIGGEHALSFAPISACNNFHNSGIGVVQFDAHADLREAYQGNIYSHASVMRRVQEELDIPLFQLGTRAYCRREQEYRQERDSIHYTDARDIETLWEKANILPEGFPEKIYISLDIDALDGLLFPATGTPVPGGLSWRQLYNLLERITRERQVIGFDLVELAPRRGFVHCTFAAAQLVYDVMGMISHPPL